MIFDVPHPIEIIPGRLYWATVDKQPPQHPSRFCFNIDANFVYEAFFHDFGPLNLAYTVRYCHHVQNCLRKNNTVVHCTTTDVKKRANAAYLMCAYQVLCLKRTAVEACKAFANADSFVPFRDASGGPCYYECTILDCVQGLEHALQLGWFDWNTFDLRAYEYYEKVEQGDMTWIVPHKFLAFASPAPESVDADGYKCMTPQELAPIFKSANIDFVLRLSKKTYDRKHFIDNGVRHEDLFFPDGSCPGPEIIARFFEIAETEPNAIAIHCKAGLGRTGTLIGLYCMKHFNFPARAFIGWNRICRPGSVLGAQQQFLCAMQHEMFQAGAAMRSGASLPSTPSLTTAEREEFEGNHDRGQGDRLRSARQRHSTGSRCEAPLREAAEMEVVSCV